MARYVFDKMTPVLHEDAVVMDTPERWGPEHLLPLSGQHPAGRWRGNFNSEAESFEVLRFRVYDDDDNLYAEGTARLFPWDTGFEPLDYAANAWGCTRIDYFEEGEWRTL